MLVLGIDTSTTNANVVINEDGIVISTVDTKGSNNHSRNLLPLIQKTLQNSRLTLDSLDVLSVAIGPGSFTGLRIGLGSVLGLADSCGKPMIGVDTLDAMAMSQKGWDGGYICPVLNARKNEVYTALYTSENGALKKLTGDLALSPESLTKMIDMPTLFLGDGYSVYSDTFHSLIPEKIETIDTPDKPCAEGVASIAYKKASGGNFDKRLKPRYVRRSQAEINWEKQHYQPGEE